MINGTATLLYRGSTDGFEAKAFHDKCNDKGPTLCVISSNHQVFGGYASSSWNSNGDYYKGDG